MRSVCITSLVFGMFMLWVTFDNQVDFLKLTADNTITQIELNNYKNIASEQYKIIEEQDKMLEEADRIFKAKNDLINKLIETLKRLEEWPPVDPNKWITYRE